MKKNCFKLLALCLAAALVFAGCGSDGKAAETASSRLQVSYESTIESDGNGKYTASQLGITKPDKITCYRGDQMKEFTAEDAE